MIESQLFEVRGLDFALWKFTQQATAESQNLTFGASLSQRNKIKRKKAFHFATSVDEMLKAFQKMESCFDENELGVDCWRMTQKLHEENVDPEKILYYGKRALRYLVEESATSDNPMSMMMITNTLPILGYACCELKRFDESVSYLNWSKRNLSKLELDNSFPVELVYSTLGVTHFHLAVVKTALGRGDEAVVHVNKIMEIQEKAKVEGKLDPEIKIVSLDQAIYDVVEQLEGMGLSEQDEVNGAVILLKEMKQTASGGDSCEKNSNCGVQN